jgi:hypothetical protein
MAQVEADLGVRATYYVALRSPFYNPLSHAGAALVRELADLGHALGVHVDLDEPRCATPPMSEVAVAAAWEHDLLAAEFPTMTLRLSLHCPPDSLLWRHVPGFDSAYGPQWRGRYYADSRGAFVHGDPEDAPAGPLQVNLHAEHWFAGTAADYGGFWR